MLWQSFAIVGQVSPLAAEDVGHAILHWQGTAHHQHDDGSVVQDNSDESRQHILFDGSLGSSFVWMSAAFSFVPASGIMPPNRRIRTVRFRSSNPCIDITELLRATLKRTELSAVLVGDESQRAYG